MKWGFLIHVIQQKIDIGMSGLNLRVIRGIGRKDGVYFDTDSGKGEGCAERPHLAPWLKRSVVPCAVLCLRRAGMERAFFAACPLGPMLGWRIYDPGVCVVYQDIRRQHSEHAEGGECKNSPPAQGGTRHV